MGSQKKRPVVLTVADREELVRVTSTGVRGASMIMRARVLLALDTSVGEVGPREVIAARVGVSLETLRLVAKRFAETGGDVDATIARKTSTAASIGPTDLDRADRQAQRCRQESLPHTLRSMWMPPTSLVTIPISVAFREEMAPAPLQRSANRLIDSRNGRLAYGVSNCWAGRLNPGSEPFPTN